ncbi:Uncharacterised protein [Klebsiella aerogenes]|nr:Uncharacterised protein [Klebsiella aerogenes]
MYQSSTRVSFSFADAWPQTSRVRPANRGIRISLPYYLLISHSGDQLISRCKKASTANHSAMVSSTKMNKAGEADIGLQTGIGIQHYVAEPLGGADPFANNRANGGDGGGHPQAGTERG